MGSLIDETGQRYGRTTVLRRANSARNGDVQWWSLCDCGAEFLVRGYSLRNGHVRSCGCLSTDVKRMRMEEWREQHPDWVEQNRQLAMDAHRLPEGEAAFNQCFARYRYAANKRGLAFSLSPEEFREITSQPCHYCGVDPQLIDSYSERLNGSYVHNGIDRKDNNLGYIPGNVLPCCTTCNMAKRDMPYHEFIAWIDGLVAHRSGDGD